MNMDIPFCQLSRLLLESLCDNNEHLRKMVKFKDNEMVSSTHPYLEIVQ